MQGEDGAPDDQPECMCVLHCACERRTYSDVLRSSISVQHSQEPDKDEALYCALPANTVCHTNSLCSCPALPWLVLQTSSLCWICTTHSAPRMEPPRARLSPGATASPPAPKPTLRTAFFSTPTPTAWGRTLLVATATGPLSSRTGWLRSLPMTTASLGSLPRPDTSHRWVQGAVGTMPLPRMHGGGGLTASAAVCCAWLSVLKGAWAAAAHSSLWSYVLLSCNFSWRVVHAKHSLSC
jgi:hypothetical protein